jgi:hypothetical protein
MEHAKFRQASDDECKVISKPNKLHTPEAEH